MPLFAPEAVQLSTGTLVVTIGAGQVIVIQPLPALPVCGVQARTGIDEPTRTLQTVVVHPLPRVGPDATQVPDGMVVLGTVQTVVWKPLPEVPVTGVQVGTWVGPLMIVGAGQVVVVQLLPVFPGDAVQVETATLVVVTGLQVVVVQRLPEVGPEGAQLETPVGPVVSGPGQVVVVQLLPEVGPEAEHDDTGVLVATRVGQLVDVQL